MKDTVIDFGIDHLKATFSLPKLETVVFVVLGLITVGLVALCCVSCCCSRAGLRRGAGLKRERADKSKKKKKTTDQWPGRELDDLLRKASVKTQKSARERGEIDLPEYEEYITKPARAAQSAPRDSSPGAWV